MLAPIRKMTSALLAVSTTARGPWGEPGAYGAAPPARTAGAVRRIWDSLPPQPAACRRRGWRDRMGEPGVQRKLNAQLTRALVPADRGVRVDLEVSPAQFVLDLPVALPGPVPDPVDPRDLGQSRPGAGRLPGAGRRPGGRLVTRYQVALGQWR